MMAIDDEATGKGGEEKGREDEQGEGAVHGKPPVGSFR